MRGNFKKFIFTEDFLEFLDIKTAPDRLTKFQVKEKKQQKPTCFAVLLIFHIKQFLNQKYLQIIMFIILKFLATPK